jgi:hypothetical protein
MVSPGICTESQVILKALRHDFIQDSLVVLPIPLASLSAKLGQHIVAGLVGLVLFLLLLGGATLGGIYLQVHVQQRGNGGIVLGAAHRGATCRAGVGMDAGCARSLGAKPFLQAGPAKCVQAVEQREGVVEDICADLGRSAADLEKPVAYRAG